MKTTEPSGKILYINYQLYYTWLWYGF